MKFLYFFASYVQKNVTFAYLNTNTNKNKSMYGKLKDFLTKELADIQNAGLYKKRAHHHYASKSRHPGKKRRNRRFKLLRKQLFRFG